MKCRLGFVSNSSSSSFIINNNTTNVKYLVDFVKENPQLVQQWNEEYDEHNTQEEMIKCAEERNECLLPGINGKAFGDEDGDVLGKVFDYILREGGSSENFSWSFHDSLR